MTPEEKGYRQGLKLGIAVCFLSAGRGLLEIFRQPTFWNVAFEVVVMAIWCFLLGSYVMLLRRAP